MLTLRRKKKEKETSGFVVVDGETLEKGYSEGKPKQESKNWMKTMLRPKKNKEGNSSQCSSSTSNSKYSPKSALNNQPSLPSEPNSSKGTLPGFNKLAQAKQMSTAAVSERSKTSKRSKTKSNRRKKTAKKGSVLNFTDLDLDEMCVVPRTDPDGELEQLEEMARAQASSYDLRAKLRDLADQSSDFTQAMVMYKKGALYHEESTRLLRTSGDMWCDETIDGETILSDQEVDEAPPEVPAKIRKEI